MNLQWKRSSSSLAAMAGLGSVVWTACGPSNPFPVNDPPPTFAIKYFLEGVSGLFYEYAGSTLVGLHLTDVVGGPFQTKGSTTFFGPSFVTFGYPYTVNNGRWPATWKISSVGGCGVGTEVKSTSNTKSRI